LRSKIGLSDAPSGDDTEVVNDSAVDIERSLLAALQM
jgi:hypothetical protein